MGLTEALSEFVVATDASRLPHEALACARDAFVDTVGVALAGVEEPASRLAAAWIGEAAARPVATVWGTALKSSPAEAAFANGVASHVLDFDDVHPLLRGHPSVALVPSALAVGEATGASGRDVLAAYVLGLEVGCKLGRLVGHGHYLRGWHTTGTVGALATTVAAAKLWKLSAGQLRMAWGLAASQVSGLLRNFGTMTKSFHAGHAARTGVSSAWLAKQGYTADASIFDGKTNFLDTYGSPDGEAADAVIASLANPWEILDPGLYVKRWPCCHAAARSVGGLLKLLHENDIRPDEVRAIEVGFLPGGDNALVSRDPASGLEGKFSIEYLAAACVLDRRLGMDSFTDAMVQRPSARRLMACVSRRRIEDGKTYSGLVGFNDLVVDTTRGRHAMRVEHTPGSKAWPMSRDDRSDKFMDTAARALGAERARDLLRRLESCAELGDVRSMVAACVRE